MSARSAWSWAAVALVVVATSVRQAPAQQTARATIAAGGDVLLQRRVVRAARDHASSGGFDWVFDGLTRVHRADDVTFANLETPLTNAYSDIVTGGERPVLGAPPEAAASLAHAGVDVVSVANNHVYDQRAVGLAETIASLRAVHVGVVGAGPDDAAAWSAWTTTRGGVRMAFVACTERINGSPGSPRSVLVARSTERERLRQALAAARAQADVVVLSIHWSHDFWARPTGSQRELAARYVEQGADIILGHGPHILQAVEKLPSPRGEALVAYSLGNLVSNQGLRWFHGRRGGGELDPAVIDPRTRDSLLLRTTVEARGGRVRIAAIEGALLWTHNNMQTRDRTGIDEVRLVPLREVDAALRDDRLREVQSTVGALVRLVP